MRATKPVFDNFNDITLQHLAVSRAHDQLKVGAS